ncbi:MAG: RNA-binding S4 domain-containing protein [Methylobacterium sp.]|jgi:ribosome-associated heat shock protein Hsp15|nr:RNA-binding S4 domain-containing protein [Methylobacterium sp.]MCA3602911.1 RNA-binding S4 domain-containing protein [Methylobacterium sp.]MCA3614725.1 RNA-binding S4 domain-containing protein [Methylobacterium sp.]MCA3623576.1 RNA-binding S4 domain-containing protein [Methylobacterium sp.]MCA3627352.1 RNA-binding S4 domain-containing protein [Methylobacterium sp.]
MARRRDKAEPQVSTRSARQRIDLFLWHARFLRTRSAAAELVRKGHARVNALRVTQPGYSLKPGDILTLALPGRTWIVRVEAFSERRGAAEDGLALYSRLDGAQPGTEVGQA